ncbi:formimidoylglutamate deiminase [Ahrensia marina]|uniref:N-formimino-L-glutamate deiminase n=1 Tax=Ahrensia marina TaxID=1514904 RepID=A0A0M9GNB4_9HYPH|nr:formimidoylglutamate deiminase [Ahrensia marina]KPB01820.1 N-formimino-L-glutamate deiminase [Ahrensia marina]
MTVIWAKTALLTDGWADDVRVEFDTNGKITFVRTDQPEEGKKVGILLAAPPNVHSHAFQRAMAGLTERRGPDPSDSFWTWRQLMFRFLDRLTPEHVEGIAAFVQMEMLEAGYATNVEFHYLHHQAGGVPYANLAEMSERIAAAASLSGIGLTLLPVHYQYGGCDRRALGAGQIRFGNNFDRFAKLHEQANKLIRSMPADSTLGLAPHSLRAVAPEDIKNALRLANGNPIHMHLAEQIPEVEEVEAHYGARPVEWFLENCEPDPNWCLIHCTQMEPHETTGLAKSGAIAGLCPITESSLGDGIFDGARWFNENGSIAIGSDSNIRISLSEELRTLDYSQRLRDNTRAALATPALSTGRRLFEAVNNGGAVAAGRKCGHIAEGYLADMIALDNDSVHLAGKSGDTILDSYIFASDDHLVKEVWSAGRHVVTDGVHIKHEEITNRYKEIMRQLGDAI